MYVSLRSSRARTFSSLAIVTHEDARFRQLVETARDCAIFLLTPDGHIASWNAGARLMTGYDATAVRGLHLSMFDAILPGHAGRTDSALAAAGKTRQWQDEGWRLREDGSRFWAHVSITPLMNELWTLDGFAVVARDMTAEHAAQLQLLESEERFRNAMEYSAIGMALVDTSGRWLRVNQALCRIIGYDADSLLGTRFQDITHPDDLASDLAHVADLLAGRTTSYEMEKRYLTKSGAVVPVLLSVSLVHDAAGSPLYFVSQIQDLSARKELEAQLLQSQKMEAVGRLAGGIAHDFNNLLAIVRMSAELLRDDERPVATRNSDVLAILAAIDRAAALTKHLLAFGRQAPSQPLPLDLNAAVESCELMLRPILAGHVVVVTELASSLPLAWLDATEAEQVLVNLVVNARDAMHDGGTLTIATTIATTAEVSDLPVESARGYIVLTVRDTGVGMDEPTRVRIFEPFFTTKGPDGGTGLGLATVYGIVARAGGHIECTTAPLQGTTFRIFLPSVAPSSLRTTSVGSTAPAGRRVLIVDDETIIGTLAARVLTREHYEVRVASSGAEALQQLAESNGAVDLLLSDMMMSPMSGAELATRVRAAWPHVQIAFMSGHMADEMQRQAGLDGVQKLRKPFAGAELLQCVERALRQ